MITIDDSQVCKQCQGQFSVMGILLTAHSYWADLGVLSCKMPCCEQSEELLLENGVIYRGYSYGAGTPHFSREEEYLVKDLVVSRDSSSLTYSLNQKEITIG